MRAIRNLKVIASILLLVGAFSLVACGNDGAGSGSSNSSNDTSYAASDVAIVYAERANSSAILDNEIKDIIGQVVENENYLSCVLADGKPDQFGIQFELNETNGRRREAAIREQTSTILGTDWSARSNESDLFAAISKANDSLGNGKQSHKVLIIVDSGVSTSGAIDFNTAQAKNGLLDPESLVQSLRQSGDLIKFDNIDEVIWYGLGNVRDSQDELKNGTKAALKNAYRAIFEAGGVTNVEFREGSANTSSASNLPSVTVVDMPIIAVDEEGNPLGKGDKLIFSEASDGNRLTFNTGQCTFIDESQARDALEETIGQLLSFPDLQITISGFTDTVGAEDYNLTLSQERAQAVANIFLDAGIDPDRLTVQGLGESSEYGEGDVAANRRVEITFA